MSRNHQRLVRPFVALATLALAAGTAGAQQHPEIRSTAPTVSIRNGDELLPNVWRLAPEYDPDIYEAPLPGGQPTHVTFITDVDSIGFLVEIGKAYDFVVRKDGVAHPTRIVGRHYTPAASFDAAYQAANRGRINIEIPEAYELVNVAIALTPTAIADPGLVYKRSPYYDEVRTWFDRHAGHAVIAQLDSALRQDPFRYHSLKMNGRAYELDGQGRLVKTAVFDRTGFRGERSNLLEPFAAGLEDFARVSDFRRFYAAHRADYDGQIAFYRDSADVAAMQEWLIGNFPGVSAYDTYRIVFSPLVAYNQSSTWFTSNGFRELQPHVNFPYADDVRRIGDMTLSDSAARLFRGNIVFTEINHGYINPEADRHAARVAAATDNRDYWVDSAKGPSYYPGNDAFNEYMNWALVNLRIAEYAPAHERDTLMGAVSRMMVKGRGFPRFAELNDFLVPLYLGRGERTLADLYPELIAWFEQENARSLGAGR